MPYYSLMECNFGIDGLESTHPLRTSEDLDRLFKEQIVLWDLAFAPSIFQVQGLEYPDSNRFVYATEPYPHPAQPDIPAWVKRLLSLPRAEFQAEQARLKAELETA